MKQASFNFSNKIPAGRLSNTLKFGVQPILPENKQMAEQDWIKRVLSETNVPLATHDITAILRDKYHVYYNDASISARMRAELKGEVVWTKK